MGNYRIETNVGGLEGLCVIEPKIFEDSRGCFFENYNYRDFCRVGIESQFVQDNQSVSKKGALRGLHFQLKNSQAKLVRVIFGEVFDVVVDLRKESKTFGKWFGVILSDKNNLQLCIPKGFAHGFLTLSKRAVFSYKVDDYYCPGDEYGIIWNDLEIGIKWPLRNIRPIISEKDLMNKPFQDIRKIL